MGSVHGVAKEPYRTWQLNNNSSTSGLVCPIDYGSLQPPVDLVSGSAVSPGAPCQGRGEGLASGLSDPVLDM